MKVFRFPRSAYSDTWFFRFIRYTLFCQVPAGSRYREILCVIKLSPVFKWNSYIQSIATSVRSNQEWSTAAYHCFYRKCSNELYSLVLPVQTFSAKEKMGLLIARFTIIPNLLNCSGVRFMFTIGFPIPSKGYYMSILLTSPPELPFYSLIKYLPFQV